MKAFAEALCVLPATICDNAHFDTAHIMSELREIHETNTDGWKYVITHSHVKNKEPFSKDEIEQLPPLQIQIWSRDS
jgi:chaperonin GroEL (HSP60 family)